MPPLQRAQSAFDITVKSSEPVPLKFAAVRGNDARGASRPEAMADG